MTHGHTHPGSDEAIHDVATTQARGGRLSRSACLTLTACGSQLDPDDVAEAGAAPAAPRAAPRLAACRATRASLARPATAVAPRGPPPAPAAAHGGDRLDRRHRRRGRRGGSGGGGRPGRRATTTPTAASRPRSCDGFKNQTGITDDTIILANVSDISGPVPGIFESAQQAHPRVTSTYFNSTEDICGHKLELELLDSRADAGADQQAYTTACDNAFAAVGSMSAFDSGGAATAENCGLPDIRSTSINARAQQVRHLLQRPGGRRRT